MAARPSPARHWCFTINNPTMYADELAATLDDMGVEYAVFQLEEGELGTPHYQGYFILPQKARFTEFKDNLPTAHFQVANGTPAQNREYCTKAEGKLGEFSEIGVFPGTGQGRRTDLDKVHEALKTGLTQAQYADEHFELFVKYPNLVTNYNAAQIRERDGVEEASCTLFIGPPGTGKSRYAFWLAQRQHGRNGVFRKPPGKWWDGYRGESAVIFDDFRGSSLSFTDFKLCVDRYPLRVEVKGTTCNMASTHFYITTNIEPSAWWKEEVTGPEHSAIFRRITSVIWMPSLNRFHQFPSYEAYYQAILVPQPEHVPGPVLEEINYGI